MYINKVVGWTNAGYGNLAPKTGPGKVVTIIYALIGKNFVLCFEWGALFSAQRFYWADKEGPVDQSGR